MAWQIFGFEFKRSEASPKTSEVKTFVDKENDDGSFTMTTSNGFGASVTRTEIEDGSGLSEGALIDTYRALAMVPEVGWAIEEITNEAIITDRKKPAIKLNLDNVKLTDNIKKEIFAAFDHVMKLLDFKNAGHRIFRRWYVDGRLYFHAMIDDKNTKEGIKEVRYIDPRKLRRIRELRKLPSTDGVMTVRQGDTVEYFIYSDTGVDVTNKLSATMPVTGLKVAKDAIASASSGILDRKNTMVLSYLHSVIKVANQLAMLEAAIVIYRLSRAPERRVFYVDVGNLPPARIEQYMNYIMNKYKTKITYDTATGAIRDTKRYLAMTEDFWMPRREGSRGTEIQTLQGGQNLGEMTDVEYFLKKLYKALGIPYSRVSGEATFSYGKAAEISRDEARFAAFISRLQGDFSHVIEDLLGKHLVLKQVMTVEEWENIKNDIHYDFTTDNYFDDQLKLATLSTKLELLGAARDYVGLFMSKETVWKEILQLTEEEIREEKKRIKEENASQPPAQGDGQDGGQPPNGGQPQPQFNDAAPTGPALNEDEALDKLMEQAEAEKDLTKALTSLVENLNDNTGK